MTFAIKNSFFLQESLSKNSILDSYRSYLFTYRENGEIKLRFFELNEWDESHEISLDRKDDEIDGLIESMDSLTPHSKASVLILDESMEFKKFAVIDEEIFNNFKDKHNDDFFIEARDVFNREGEELYVNLF